MGLRCDRGAYDPGVAVAQDASRSWRAAAPAATSAAVVAEHGMVVAQEKIAARIGADVLRQGGNAVDAAVATGFAMAVTYPQAGNLGGGGFMVIHLRARNEDIAIDYRETGPRRSRPRFPRRPTASPTTRSRVIRRWVSACPARSPGWRWRWINIGSGKFTLARTAGARDCAGARRLRRDRRHRRLAAAKLQATGAVAGDREDLRACGRHAGRRRRPTDSSRSGRDPVGDRRAGTARVLRGAGRGETGEGDPRRRAAS